MPPTINITLRSRPFMDDPEGAPAYYEAIGRFLCLWGRFETHFSSILLSITNLPGGDVLRDPNISEAVPTSFRKRSDLWKKAFRLLPQLTPHAQAARQLIIAASLTNKDRNILIHSSWSGFTSEDPLTATFINHRHKDDKFYSSSYSISLDQINAMLASADRLNSLLLPLTFHVVSLYPPRTAKN